MLTIDVITPIVDDPRVFGEIAAANALSDVWAMGGRPEVALSFVGFPTDKLPLAALSEVMDRTHRQRVVLVRGAAGYCGLVDLQLVAEVPEAERAWMKVSDAMVPLVSLPPSASWTRLAEELDRCSVSQLPILDASGEVLGWVGDRELRLGLRAGGAAVATDRSPASG